MKILINFSLALIFCGGFFSCSDDVVATVDQPKVVFAATLSGAQEVPAVTTTATGTATLTFNTVTRAFDLQVTHTIPNATNGHIHKGAAGVNGGAVIPFVTFASPINFQFNVLDLAQQADLYDGLYYVNIHTAAFPGGELRGQLLRK